MLSFILSPLYRWLAAAGAALVFLASIYAKGRKDASDKASLKSLRENQDAITKANNARNKSAAESDRGGLLNDDGFKRRD
jgi:hypothetical protein